ncbi:MAG: ATP synthase F1 subunit delta [Chloroflexi bacterium]|nr:ATP synthase F1 subunit delta [Chloroflexota bacterium]MCI0790154.1 ATP synthase F1 subunit delta [Chloroflexota bacterium]MCI0795184.1 ATP synthase F1 subunit delta [Chloroflexota bacterium]MCI0868089.1 ATP synthase F1 subunit delta [Chloroflexota bacterium]
MPKGASARRYAQAAFEIALENDEFDAWLEDLSYLAAALQSDEFSGFLDAPQVAVSQKIKLIDETVAGTISPLSRNLLALLASRNSAHLVPSITGAYQEMLDAHRGIERAEIVSAVPLSDEQQSRVSNMLKDMVGKEIALTVRVDPQILGGIVARVGDSLIDGSTRTKLEGLRRELLQQA